jgi:dTDP-4-amino-4,6-dideoxygalactose transaminase
MRPVARYDFAAQLGGDLEAVLESMRQVVLRGGHGPDAEVAAFEAEFATFLGARYACGVNTGTDALVMALGALGVGSGDEVVTQANTFHATVAAVCLCGARPVLADARDDTFLMDEERFAAALTPRTKVVIPVHLFGKPTPMQRISSLSAAHGFAIVEDAAQAHGARIDGQRVGTFGTFGCFSFHPSKNLASAGDGGAVVTQDAELALEIRRRRALGQVRQNVHEVVSGNSRLHELQAVVLRAKLPKLDGWNAKRRELAATYRDALDDLPLSFQAIEPQEEHVFHLFQVRSGERDALLTYLQRLGIDAVVRYPTPVHLQPAFAGLGWQRGEFPVAERLAEELLCLPLRPDMSDGEISAVVEGVRAFYGR